jgi:hypothetical protein
MPSLAPTLTRSSSFPAEVVLQVNGHNGTSSLLPQPMCMAHDRVRFAESRKYVLKAALVVYKALKDTDSSPSVQAQSTARSPSPTGYLAMLHFFLALVAAGFVNGAPSTPFKGCPNGGLGLGLTWICPEGMPFLVAAVKLA